MIVTKDNFKQVYTQAGKYSGQDLQHIKHVYVSSMDLTPEKPYITPHDFEEYLRLLLALEKYDPLIVFLENKVTGKRIFSLFTYA